MGKASRFEKSPTPGPLPQQPATSHLIPVTCSSCHPALTATRREIGDVQLHENKESAFSKPQQKSVLLKKRRRPPAGKAIDNTTPKSQQRNSLKTTLERGASTRNTPRIELHEKKGQSAILPATKTHVFVPPEVTAATEHHSSLAALPTHHSSLPSSPAAAAGRLHGF